MIAFDIPSEYIPTLMEQLCAIWLDLHRMRFVFYKSAILDLLTNSDYDSLMKKNYSNIKVTGITDVEDNCYNTITKVKSK